MLEENPLRRITAEAALRHPWITRGVAELTGLTKKKRELLASDVTATDGEKEKTELANHDSGTAANEPGPSNPPGPSTPAGPPNPANSSNLAQAVSLGENPERKTKKLKLEQRDMNVSVTV